MYINIFRRTYLCTYELSEYNMTRMMHNTHAFIQSQYNVYTQMSNSIDNWIIESLKDWVASSQFNHPYIHKNREMHWFSSKGCF